jgi:general secretion pathway protein K
MMKKRNPKNNESGVALILALLFMVLLTVLVVEFSYEMQVEASFASNSGGDFEAYLAARSAVAKGIALLASDLEEDDASGEPAHDSALDIVPWYEGVPFEPLNNAVMRGSIGDEYGKLNLNAIFDYAQSPPVAREPMVNALREFFLLRASDSDMVPPEALVDALLDWLDYGDQDEVRAEGAENDYYMSLENPFPCKNGPMDSIEELLLIQGVTPEFFYGDPELDQFPLSEYLTVHGDWSGRVNPNTALPETLAAVIAGHTGQSADVGRGQEIFDRAREEPFLEVAALDSMVGEAPKAKKPKKPAAGSADPKKPANAKDVEEPSAAQKAFVVSSNVFRVRGDGMLEDIMVRVEAYVWRTPLDLSFLEASIPQAENDAPSNENVAAQNEAGGPPPIPGEPFRILDWRVIR